MKIRYALTLTQEGSLNEVLGSIVKPGLSLADVIKAMEEVTFVAETVAHLHGLERSIIPKTDRAREIIAILEGK